MPLFPQAGSGGPVDASPQSRRSRATVALLMAAILVLSLMFLQRCFDAGDERKAFDLVRQYRPSPGGVPAGELLQARNGGAPAACTAVVRSGCRGLVEVDCAVGTEAEPYAFTVDLVRRQVAPAGPSTARRLGASAPPGRVPANR